MFKPSISVQEKKRKIDFKLAAMAAILDFPIETILVIFYLKVTPKLTRFESTGLSVQKKKRKIDFQDGRYGGHLGFPIGTILVIFIYTSPRCFLSRFESIGLSVQEKKRKLVST